MRCSACRATLCARSRASVYRAVSIRTHWLDGPTGLGSGLHQGRRRTLGQRLRRGIAALVERLYTADMVNAMKAVNIAEGEGLHELLKAVVEAAKADARKRAAQLVPAGVEQPPNADQPPLDRLTVSAPPLVFRIDSLQSTIVGEDIWPRLAGVGVLMARTPKLSDVPADWRSLNVATLHAPLVNGARQDLSERNSMKVRASGFPDGSIVDPVPYQISEDPAGIRSVVITYENRSIVGEMPTDARTTDTGTSEIARRVEGYGFPPPKSKWMLPTLSFGYAYHITPYVVGHGGALPPWLRAHVESPLDINQIIREEHGVEQAFIKTTGNLTGAIRSALYRRTDQSVRHVCGTRGSCRDAAWRGAAGRRTSHSPGSCTVLGGSTVRFFLNKEGRRGIVNMPAGAGAAVGIGSIRC